MSIPICNLWQYDFMILNSFYIFLCNCFAQCNIFIQMLKFYIKNCGLNFVKTAITPCILEYVFFLATVVCKTSEVDDPPKIAGRYTKNSRCRKLPYFYENRRNCRKI